MTERDRRIKESLEAAPGAPKPATTAQINFMEILFRDLGFDRAQRNAFLSAELGRPVRFLNELTSAEGSRIISSLKERKDEAK